MKKQQEKVAKTREELLEKHKQTIVHEVESINKWANKLVKSVHSKKHKLTDAQTLQVKDAIIAIFNETVEKIEPTKTPIQESFRL